MAANSVDESRDRIVAALLESPEYAHEDGLGLGTFLAAVCVDVLPHDDGRPDLSLCMVVVGGYVGVVEEREQLGLVPLQALDQTTRVPLLPLLCQQVVQPLLQPLPSRGESRRWQFATSLAEANRVADQPLQLLGERWPIVTRVVVMLGPFQVAQQVWQAFLLPRADDRVVGAPEVGHQHPSELLLEEFLQGRTAAAPVDHVIGNGLGGKAPQPVGLAIDPPSRLVGMKYCTVESLGLDLQVPGQEHLAQPVPHLDQATGGELELKMEVEHVDDLRQS